MKIVVDENIPRRTVRALREMGYEVTDVRGTPEAGASDNELWRTAQARTALIISTDKGFASRWNEPHYGILVVRLRQPNRAKIHDRIMLAMRRFAEHEWPGLLVVMRDRTQIVRRSRSRRH